MPVIFGVWSDRPCISISRSFPVNITYGFASHDTEYLATVLFSDCLLLSEWCSSQSAFRWPWWKSCASRCTLWLPIAVRIYYLWNDISELWDIHHLILRRVLRPVYISLAMTRTKGKLQTFDCIETTQLSTTLMPSLRLGNTAPDFEAQTTIGPIKFHEWIGDSWVSCVDYSAYFYSIWYLSKHRQYYSLIREILPPCAPPSWVRLHAAHLILQSATSRSLVFLQIISMTTTNGSRTSTPMALKLDLRTSNFP